MRFIGLIAVGMAAAMTACSGGGSSGTLPAGRAATTSSVAAGAVRTASDGGGCGTGHHEDSASRGALERDHGDGDHGTGSGCCPSGATPAPGSGGTGTRDRDRHNDEDGGNKPAATCCIPTATPPGPGGPGTRDRGRHGDDEGGDGDGHHATPTPAPTLPPCPPNLTVTPATVTIDCAVSSTTVITVKGTPAGIKAVATDPTVAVVFLPTVVNGNTQFIVQGIAGLSTTITITDTAGDKITVPVTTRNCPLPTPLPSPIQTPTPSPTPGR